MEQNTNRTKCKNTKIQPPYSRPPPLTHLCSIRTPSSVFRQICGNSTVPTNIMGTAVPTNLAEQYTWCSNRKSMR